MERKTVWENVEALVSEENKVAVGRLEERAGAARRELDELKSAPVAIEPVSTRKTVFGFEVVEKKMISVLNSAIPEKEETLSMLEVRVRDRKQFSQAQMDFAEKLHAQGFQPQGIVPKPLFIALCRKFGLWRYEHIDEAGKTKISPKAGPFFRILNFMLMVSILPLVGMFFGIAPAMLCVAGALVSGLISSYFFFGFLSGGHLNFPPGIKIVGGIFMAGTTFIYVKIFLLLIFYDDNYFDFTNLLFSLVDWAVALALILQFEERLTLIEYFMFRFSPKSLLLHLLWPDCCDSNDREAQSVSVKFRVQPTSSFIAILSRMKEMELQPCIATVPKAIKLDRKEALAGYLKEQWRLDPIIYHCKGNWVAVLDQSGEFASEKEVMEWVKREGLKVCFN